MTISDATHSLALSKEARPAAPKGATTGESVRLVEAIACVEPTWVEAVAVVQAVCAQLAPGEAAPPLDAIVISPAGRVAFPRGGACDDTTAVTAVGRLLNAILDSGDCPMSVWDATEKARYAPAKVGTVARFAATLTCLAASHGPQELQRYVESVHESEAAARSQRRNRSRRSA